MTILKLDYQKNEKSTVTVQMNVSEMYAIKEALKRTVKYNLYHETKQEMLALLFDMCLLTPLMSNGMVNVCDLNDAREFHLKFVEGK